jgi:hypothetical protein
MLGADERFVRLRRRKKGRRADIGEEAKGDGEEPIDKRPMRLISEGWMDPACRKVKEDDAHIHSFG